MRKIKTLISVSLAMAVVTPVVFAHQVSAASWQILYSSRWWNGTQLVSQVVTPQGADLPYTLEEWTNPADPYDVRFTAPATNTGGNLREFFWPASTPDVLDSQTCAVWTKQTDGLTQQGSAQRIRRTYDEFGNLVSTRGITVTKNIWYAANWNFNVHVWDTSDTAHPYTMIGQFDMSEVLGKMYYDENGQFQSNLKPMPWKLCTRVVGNTLTLKVWSNETFTPSWDDPKYTRSLTIPDAWVQPGKTGWYIGHVRPGHTAEFKNIHTHVYQ